VNVSNFCNCCVSKGLGSNITKLVEYKCMIVHLSVPAPEL